MTKLPSPRKVAGPHTAIYENYYKLVDPRNKGKIKAEEAAKFLKKSHLSETVLSKIWDIADSKSRGYLDKPGMFVALKLCALAQQGRHLSISDILANVPPPKIEDLSSNYWTVSSSERKKYEQLFLMLEPINGYVPGSTVKNALMNSKLPLETLGKIWDLADMDNDGRLNLQEFIIAMHLVCKALEKNTVPNVLPSELADSSKSNANDDNTLKLSTISSANWSFSESKSNVNDDNTLKLSTISSANWNFSENKFNPNDDNILKLSTIPSANWSFSESKSNVNDDNTLKLSTISSANWNFSESKTNPNDDNTVKLSTIPSANWSFSESKSNVNDDNTLKLSTIPSANWNFSERKSNSNDDNTLKLSTMSSANWSFSEPTKSLHTDEWVVSHDDQIAAEKLFVQVDKDMDGFVSGIEIKDTFIKSGLPQTVLAHIWNLCDISLSGKLNNEQFALAMWLIKQKLNGSELPNTLLYEMIPPSFKKMNCGMVFHNNDVSVFANPELNMLSREIAEIIKEKHIIEQDISQKESDIQIQTGKMKCLQSELDSLEETLRQLDNQKEEVQNGLKELKSEVEKLRCQTSKQESTLRVEEDELDSRRREIETFKVTEKNLESQKYECKSDLNKLLKQLQKKQLQISQIKANMTQLEEQQHQIVDATAHLDDALAVGNTLLIPQSSLLFSAKLDETIYSLHLNSVTSKTINDEKESLQTKDSKNEKSFLSSKNDQIIQQNPNSLGTAFPVAVENIKDPFGDDPFVPLCIPLQLDRTGPALPPKQSKLPPPRPAPRRPAQPPITTPRLSIKISPVGSQLTNSDPFRNKSTFNNDPSGTLDFADFANFDSISTPIVDDFYTKCKLDKDIKKDPFVANNLADFEEDPFANYRYDDILMISDPFSENREEDVKMKIKCKDVTKNGK